MSCRGSKREIDGAKARPLADSSRVHTFGSDGIFGRRKVQGRVTPRSSGGQNHGKPEGLMGGLGCSE